MNKKRIRKYNRLTKSAGQLFKEHMEGEEVKPSEKLDFAEILEKLHNGDFFDLSDAEKKELTTRFGNSVIEGITSAMNKFKDYKFSILKISVERVSLNPLRYAFDINVQVPEDGEDTAKA